MHRDEDGFFHYRGSIETYRGYRLPHWDVEDGIYFVTFCLAGSIPADTARGLSEEFHAELDAFVEREEPTAEERAERALELYLETFDGRLDRGMGACHLENPRLAALVRDAFRYFDGARYDLFAWVVMPNHVHVVFRRYTDHSIGDVLGSWKSYTAQKAREIVDFDEHFWQRGYFDRLIRSEREFKNVCRYVWENPERAGLDEWPWREIERPG